MNETCRKFGAPETQLQEFEFWTILLRPAQVTLGSMVLVCREPVGSFGEISQSASAELQQATAAIECVLSERFAYDKINYLMLMMVDPDVHFHVLPRYETERAFEGSRFVDGSWPGPPDITANLGLAEPQFVSLRDALREDFSKLG